MVSNPGPHSYSLLLIMALSTKPVSIRIDTGLVDKAIINKNTGLIGAIKSAISILIWLHIDPMNIP